MFLDKFLFSTILFFQVCLTAHALPPGGTPIDPDWSGDGRTASFTTVDQSFETLEGTHTPPSENEFHLAEMAIVNFSNLPGMRLQSLETLIANAVHHRNDAPVTDRVEFLDPIAEAIYPGVRLYHITEWLRSLLGDEHFMVEMFQQETTNQIWDHIRSIPNDHEALALANALERIGDPTESVVALRASMHPVPPPFPAGYNIEEPIIPTEIRRAMRIFRGQEQPRQGEDLLMLADRLVSYWEGQNDPENQLDHLQFWNDFIREQIQHQEDASEGPNLNILSHIVRQLAQHPERAPTLLQATILERLRTEPDPMVEDHLTIELFEQLFVMGHVVNAFRDEVSVQANEREQTASCPADYVTLAVLYDRMGWHARAAHMRAEARRIGAWRPPALGMARETQASAAF